jgi:membrane-bound lytic murein transglycosylase D
MDVSRLLCAVLLAATILLTGCDPEQPVPFPASRQSQAFAPTLAIPAASTASFFPHSSKSDPAALAGQTTSPPAKTATPSAQTASPDQQPNAQQIKNQQLRNQQLIDAVEQAYQGGISNYRAGHLEAAKASFDYAVDQMLLSGLDLKNDPQLSAEFERIVDAVNTLEMEALKQGNGFEPRIESAPVEVANDVTFAPDPTLTAQVRAELQTTQSDLPLVLNDYVASYINFFANTKSGHATIVHSLTRAGRYKSMIQRILAEEGVPQDLIYQAVAESGFQVRIMNGRGSGAGGMWQFMPGDAHAPPRSAWYDQRFDPEQSTRAYARYIKSLYNQLGDWYLAMAAYDWGAGNVQRAVQRTGYADFWELYRRNVLPQETKNYVPIILAATIMAKNPKQYGLDTIVADPPLITDNVTTNYSVDLRLVSDIVEAPLQEVVALNPSLLRMATPPDDSFDLHLPPGTKDLFTKRIDEIPVERRRSWRFHKVTSGETLEDVARSYHVSATEIAFVNQLGETTDLAGVESLIVPVPAVASSSAARSTRYVAKKGDTLVTLADRFNVSVDDLRSWNRLKGTTIAPGHSLYVSEPARVASPRSRHAALKASSSHARTTASAKSAQASTGHAAAHASSASKPRKKHSTVP